MSQTTIQDPKVLYVRAVSHNAPFFKSPKTSYCKIGNEILNGNIEWLKVLEQIMTIKKLTLKHLSRDLAVDEQVLKKIVETNDTSALDFKTGAKLLALQDSL